ncbi:MAG: hypothetical protein AAFN77_07700 [Planctomycetota bacterium]
MQAAQLVLSSSGSGESSNQLVARSESVTDELAQHLANIVPSRNSLEYGQRESICYSSVTVPRLGERFAFVRSVVGPIDAQLQRQIISYAVVLERRQFQKFDFHAPNVIHCLRSSGGLILMNDPPPILPAVDLPDRFMRGLLGSRTSQDQCEKVSGGLTLHEQVGVLGAKRPLDLAAAIFNSIAIEERSALCFSVNRRANDASVFRMYVLSKDDKDLSREFAQQQIRPISLDERAVAVG